VAGLGGKCGKSRRGSPTFVATLFSPCAGAPACPLWIGHDWKCQMEKWRASAENYFWGWRCSKWAGLVKKRSTNYVQVGFGNITWNI
jgi:hypothetical protein